MVRQQRKSIELLKRKVEDRDERVADLEARVVELENRKDGGLKGVTISAVGVVLAALVTGVFAIITDDDPVRTTPPTPPTVECSKEKAQAKRVYRSDGFWTPLPESSNVETQCDINTYILELPVLPKPTP